MLVEFEQNHMVRTILFFFFFDKKWLTIFDKVLMPFCKTINLKTIIFQHSKTNGTQTHVTRLKVALQTQSVSTKQTVA